MSSEQTKVFQSKEPYWIIPFLRKISLYGVLLTGAYMFLQPKLTEAGINPWEIIEEIKEELDSGDFLNNEYSDEEETYLDIESVNIGGELFVQNTNNSDVLYLACENPLQIKGDIELLTERSQIAADCGTLSSNGDFLFTLVPSPEYQKCVVTITLSEDQYVSTTFRVSAVPNPTPTLGGKEGGEMDAVEMSTQSGILPRLKDFDLPARCYIVSSEITRVPALGDDPTTLINDGPRFSDEVKVLLQAAQPNDNYQFNNIQARCPGDREPRTISSMAFIIK